jgi:DNA invertase Pin-like site-specific DNA recombinase
LELGYARVSTTEPSLERQLDALAAASIPDERVYIDKKTSATVDRTGLGELLAHTGPATPSSCTPWTGSAATCARSSTSSTTSPNEGSGTVAGRPAAHRHADAGMARIAFLLLAMFAEMERTFTAERAAHARTVAEASGRQIGRPLAHPADKIEYARFLKAQGDSLGVIAAKTGIPKTSLHRYLDQTTVRAEES